MIGRTKTESVFSAIGLSPRYADRRRRAPPFKRPSRQTRTTPSESPHCAGHRGIPRGVIIALSGEVGQQVGPQSGADDALHDDWCGAEVIAFCGECAGWR